MDEREKRARKRIDDALMPGTAFAADVFPTAFMSAHTRFASFDAMCEAIGVRTAQEFRAFPPEQWEAHVRATTDFTSWDLMKISGGAEAIARHVRP